MTATVNAADICSLVPHAGAMCLIGSVVSWDGLAIHCRAASHRDTGHPLAHGGRLAALHLIEYSAQAMALHGGLCARSGGSIAAPGMLVSARDVGFEVDRVDDIEADLDIHASRLLASAGGWLYGFVIEAAGRKLAAGRVAVLPMLNANLAAP